MSPEERRCLVGATRGNARRAQQAAARAAFAAYQEWLPEAVDKTIGQVHRHSRPESRCENELVDAAGIHGEPSVAMRAKR